jgi:bifunctional enzyme CysN/CysC
MGDEKKQTRVVVVGDVDHGKSTLIGRLLHDTGNLPTGKVEELRAASDRRGGTFEWSYVLDALQSERDQAVTIDTTRVWLRVPERDIVLIDAPGHEQFLRNMVTGSSDAELALLVVDAGRGVTEQTRRHLLLLELLGVTACTVVVNKMDAIDYDRKRFEEIRAELTDAIERIRVALHACVPISARSGENLAVKAPSLAWFDGPTLLEALTTFDSPVATESDFRMFVQGVLRRGDRRIAVGRIDAGRIAAGDAVVALPSRQALRVRSIERWPQGAATAETGASIGLIFDGDVFVDRGDLLSDSVHPPTLSRRFVARVAWFGEHEPVVGEAFSMRVGTRTVTVEIEELVRVVDVETLSAQQRAPRSGDIIELALRSSEAVPVDDTVQVASTNRAIMLQATNVIAGGVIVRVLQEQAERRVLFPSRNFVSRATREERNGHASAVIWMTGRPASGKSTIANRLERLLFDRGRRVCVLDGDTMRSGLCSDLGFTPEDRTENIRRASEVAKLLADAGNVVITAFISPYEQDREIARGVIGDNFYEVYVKADLQLCEQRDPKGLYKRARSGELKHFTGISDEYEEPVSPALLLDTTTVNIDQSVDDALTFVEGLIRLRT